MPHTAGPWRVEDGTTLVWGKCDPDDNTTYGMGYPVAVASIKLGHGSPFCREYREDEAVANAHLIAAAPTLLEACQSVWLMLADTGDNELRLIADECRAAIAKAMGEK